MNMAFSQLKLLRKQNFYTVVSPKTTFFFKFIYLEDICYLIVIFMQPIRCCVFPSQQHGNQPVNYEF